MIDRTYDTRSRAEILAGKHFTPYLQGTRIDEVGLRELRTLDAFFLWAQKTEVQVPRIEDFLAFTASTASPRKLENLRTAFDRIAPEGAAICQTIRDAIREKRPRSRACDRRSREAIIAEAHFAPYRHLTELDMVTLEDLRVLDRFLIFAEARRIEIPVVEDFLDFVDDRTSSRRLRNLRAALDTLLPGNPAVLLTLQQAIRQKTPPSAPKPSKPRPCARYRVALTALPQEWQAALPSMLSWILAQGSSIRGCRSRWQWSAADRTSWKTCSTRLPMAPARICSEGTRSMHDVRVFARVFAWSGPDGSGRADGCRYSERRTSGACRRWMRPGTTPCAPAWCRESPERRMPGPIVNLRAPLWEGAPTDGRCPK